MVAVAAGRRPGVGGAGRRRAGCGGQAGQQQLNQQQAQQQRLLAVAVAARFAEARTTTAASADASAAAGAGCCVEFLDTGGRCARSGAGAAGGSASPRGASAEGRRDGAPARIAGNGASASAAASLFTMQGKKGVNQDAMVLVENFGSKDGAIFCGVFDGHGPNGHLVAKRVRDLLPVKLIANIGRDDYKETSTSSITSGTTRGGTTQHVGEDTDAAHGNENGEYPEIFTALRASFLRAFYVMDRDLKMHKNIDCVFSGTTAVTVIKQGQNLIIGNLGDSRAVLGTRDENNQLLAVQLTVDLKPNIPIILVFLAEIKQSESFTGEAERIRQRRGRIFSLPDEPNVARVWLPTFNSPGLAMARSFGDFCLKNYGIISMPDVSYHHITDKDEFVVLATDGVWDVLSNAEVVSIVNNAPSQALAARFLVESARRAWRTLYPTSKTDDCAAVCLFLNTETTNTSPVPKPKFWQVMQNQAASGAGVPANLVTALIANEEWSILDGISGPVTVPALPKPSSVAKESIKD
ncbi:hypothetical protein EJB05_37102, partial [Eragrostis curvula]